MSCGWEWVAVWWRCVNISSEERLRPPPPSTHELTTQAMRSEWCQQFPSTQHSSCCSPSTLLSAQIWLSAIKTLAIKESCWIKPKLLIHYQVHFPFFRPGFSSGVLCGIACVGPKMKCSVCWWAPPPPLMPWLQVTPPLWWPTLSEVRDQERSRAPDQGSVSLGIFTWSHLQHLQSATFILSQHSVHNHYLAVIFYQPIGLKSNIKYP